MTDGNAGLSRRAFLTGAGTALAAGGTAAAQQEENGTASGNQTNASGNNSTAGNASAEAGGNPSKGGTQSGTTDNQSGNQSGNESGGGNQSGGGNESGGGNQSGGSGGASAMTKTVEVGPNNELVFKPAEVQVTPGSTVKWVWKSDTHNVVPESIPDGASWEGSKGGESKTYDTGHEYSHTFDTEGTYEYFCAPHKSAGMTGTVEVTPDAGGGGGGGGGSNVPTVPDSAKSLGVATTFSMMATLGLAYFFLKYGGDYETQ